MKKLLLAIVLSLLMTVPSFATDVIYVVDFAEANVATGGAGTKTEVVIPSQICKMIKLTGGLENGESSTSFDLTLFSDNVAGTAQEDTLYKVNNVTTGYYDDDTPCWLSSTATSGNYISYLINNDGAESDFSFLMYMRCYKTKAY